MKTREKNILGLLLFTLVAIIAISGLFRINAVAKEKSFSKYQAQLEKDFREDIKAVMKAAGAKNAGINMTKITEDGLYYSYKVEINLPGYINLNDAEEAKLLESLYALDFNIENSSILFLLSGKEEA